MRSAAFSLLLALVVCQLYCPTAYPDSASRSLEEAWFQEEARHDFKAAAELYQNVIDNYPDDEAALANASLGIARCIAQTGRTEDAVAQLKRIIDKFSTQPTVVSRATAYLEKLNRQAAPPSVIRKELLSSYLSELKSTEIHLKKRAIAGLAQLGDPSAVPRLIPLLDDDELSVRKAAVSSLGKIGDPSAVPALLKLLKDQDLKPDVASALAAVGDSSVVPQLINATYQELALGAYSQPLKALWTPQATILVLELLKDASPHVKINWALLLPELDPAQALPIISEWLKDAHSPLRAAAAEALGRIGDPSAVTGLIAALSDDAINVQVSACNSLGQLKAGEAVAYLISILESGSPMVAHSAAGALNIIRDPSALVPLIAAGRLARDWTISEREAPFIAQGLSHTDPLTRRHCAALLAEIATLSQRNTLLAALSDDDERVRASAAKAFLRLKTQVALPQLLNHLKDPSALVRAAAAQAISQIGDPAATQPLAEALHDSDPRVRKAAAHALAAVADESAVPAFSQLLSSTDTEFRTLAIQALSRLKATDFLDEIQGELRYGLPQIRAAAAQALGDMEDPDSQDLLIFALSDPSPLVRAAAADALGKLRSTPSVKPLASLLMSSSGPSPQPESVRRAAASALGTIAAEPAREALSFALGNDPSSFIRIISAESLALLNDNSGIPLLISFLKDDSVAIRKAAAVALRRMRVEAALDALIYVSNKDPNEEVRQVATKAIEEIRARE